MRTAKRSRGRGRQRALGAGLLAGALLCGCATSRGVLDVRVPDAANPARGPAVKLVRVSDLREFQRRPSEPSIPSLKDAQLDNAAITSRAIARKRNSYGQALGDILLPEGRTVQQLSREALARGLRESGYRVLGEGDAGYAAAVPLEAEIHQFWAWFSPGFWAAHLEFDTRIRVSGPLAPFEDGEDFHGHVRLGTQAASGGAWLNTVSQGLESLNEDMKTKLRGSADIAAPAAP